MNSQEAQNSQSPKFSDPKEQNRILRSLQLTKRFAQALRENDMLPLTALPIEILQINVGKVCNQTCSHCHVDAGPWRKESMTDQVVDKIIEICETSSLSTVDITGGAPELHPRFREIVQRVSKPCRKVIHRCNFTAIMTKPLQDIPDLLAEHKVEIVGSLPCYTMDNLDKQRGDGVFETSIKAIRHLNDLGYGQEGSELVLNFVFNPIGDSLPGNEIEMQADFKRELNNRYGIVFNNLFAITNIPVGRFLKHLVEEDRIDDYMTLLVNAFNPATIAPLMCRDMISVCWEGNLYDCDFNQMLELKVDGQVPQTVFDWDAKLLEQRAIVIGEHCYGCTAGAGSSCGGQTI